MKREAITPTKDTPPAGGTYSLGITHGGFWYFSGQIGLDPKTGKLKEGFQDQLAQTLDHIDHLLLAAHLNRGHVIKTTVFLTDLSYFPRVNEAYEQFFEKPYPARSCVQVSALPLGANIEIEVVAAVP